MKPVLDYRTPEDKPQTHYAPDWDDERVARYFGFGVGLLVLTLLFIVTSIISDIMYGR